MADHDWIQSAEAERKGWPDSFLLPAFGLPSAGVTLAPPERASGGREDNYPAPPPVAVGSTAPAATVFPHPQAYQPQSPYWPAAAPVAGPQAPRWPDVAPAAAPAGAVSWPAPVAAQAAPPAAALTSSQAVWPGSGPEFPSWPLPATIPPPIPGQPSFGAAAAAELPRWPSLPSTPPPAALWPPAVAISSVGTPGPSLPSPEAIPTPQVPAGQGGLQEVLQGLVSILRSLAGQPQLQNGIQLPTSPLQQSIVDVWRGGMGDDPAQGEGFAAASPSMNLSTRAGVFGGSFLAGAGSAYRGRGPLLAGNQVRAPGSNFYEPGR